MTCRLFKLPFGGSRKSAGQGRAGDGKGITQGVPMICLAGGSRHRKLHLHDKTKNARQAHDYFALFDCTNSSTTDFGCGCCNLCDAFICPNPPSPNKISQLTVLGPTSRIDKLGQHKLPECSVTFCSAYRLLNFPSQASGILYFGCRAKVSCNRLVLYIPE